MSTIFCVEDESNIRELISRVKAMLRRTERHSVSDTSPLDCRCISLNTLFLQTARR